MLFKHNKQEQNTPHVYKLCYKFVTVQKTDMKAV